MKRLITVDRGDRALYIACLAMWTAIFFVVIPAMTPKLPASWWLDVRTVNVADGGAAVRIDRTIFAHWFDKTGYRKPDDRGCFPHEATTVAPNDMVGVNGRQMAAGEMACRFRYYTGDVRVLIRNVSGPTPSICPGGRSDVRFPDDAPYPESPPTLRWFLDSPPNAGCLLVEGDYVADFTWTRRLFGLEFRAGPVSSNIFHVPGAVL